MEGTTRVDTGHGDASVLVVDDEPDLSWVLSFNLEVEGYRTFVAADGRTALEAVREHRPTLIILDVMMPVMDGWSVLEELRELPDAERPLTVVISARTSPADRDRAEELGVDAYIPKPFELDEVIAVVRSLAPPS
ncbi:MAG: response regulator [Actinobacteria bacterium]|nr:response regulator [Actinomycetota bacterium]